MGNKGLKIKDFILKLYQSKSTVFTIDEIALISGDTDRPNLKAKIHYYVKKGNLRNIRKGVYAKIDYDPLELATKIFTPSYISLETVLSREGVIFQPYETIFVISYLARRIDVDSHPIQYRRLKESLLLEPKGVIVKQNYAIATKERAFLDSIYLYGEYFIDNPDVIDKERVLSLLEIYNSRAFVQRVQKILKNA
jgi:predicted transcriptional regulator of viral defense system